MVNAFLINSKPNAKKKMTIPYSVYWSPIADKFYLKILEFILKK